MAISLKQVDLIPEDYVPGPEGRYRFSEIKDSIIEFGGNAYDGSRVWLKTGIKFGILDNNGNDQFTDYIQQDVQSKIQKYNELIRKWNDFISSQNTNINADQWLEYIKTASK